MAAFIISKAMIAVAESDGAVMAGSSAGLLATQYSDAARG